MANSKKLKTGNVEFDLNEFDDDATNVLISLRMSLSMQKDLKKLALNDKYQGKYQVLIKDILAQHIANSKLSHKRKAV